MNVYDFDKTIYDGDSTLDFYLFSLKKNQFNLHEKNGAKLISLRALNIKPYLIENFLLNS